jgi:hypothetical protein
LTQFQATFSEGNITRRLQAFIPALDAADDDVFATIITFPEWRRIVNVLQHVSAEEDFKVVGQLISTLLSRNTAAGPAHSIIVGLILGDKATHVRHIVRFASHLASIQLVQADRGQVHAAIEKVLGTSQCQKDAENALGHLIPASTTLLSQGDPPPNLALPEKPLVQALSHRRPIGIAKILLNYALLCASSNPAFSASLAVVIRQGNPKMSFQTLPISLVVLGCGLVLGNTTIHDAEISKQLFGWLAPIQRHGNDASLDEIYKFFQEAIFDGEERLKGWAVPFTLIAFKDAKLGNATEKKFFGAVFTKFPEEAVKELIEQTATAFQPYSSARDRELILAAKRAVFVLGVWPQKKEKFLDLVPQGTIDSLPKKTHDWIAIRSALFG